MRAALATRTGRDTAVVFSGQVVNAAIGFSLNIVLMRQLSLDQYGNFTLFNSSMMLLAGFFHLGWIETYVRFGAMHLGTEKFGALRGLVFRRLLIGSTVLAVAAAALSPWIANHFYNRHGFTGFLCAAALGAFGMGLVSFALNDCRVRKLFWRFFGLQTGGTLTRFAVCVLALAIGALTVRVAVAAYALVPLAVAGYALFWPGKGILRDRAGGAPVDPATVREMNVYNGWLLVSMFTTNLTGNLDSQLMAHYHGNQALSHYGAVGRLTLPLNFLVTALTTTLLPRLSSARSDDEVRYYLSQLKLFLVPLGALVALSCFLAPPLLVWVAGPGYETIGTLLRFQIFSMLIVLITNPLGLVLYAWGWSWVFAYLNVAQLILNVALCVWWIPTAGPMGAIRAGIAINLLGFAFVTVALWMGLRRRPRRSIVKV